MKFLLRIACGSLLVAVAAGIYLVVKDSGVVSVHYADTPNAQHQAIKASLETWRGFDVAAKNLDAVFLVPRDLQIVSTDCGQPIAAYDPAQATIFMCYELVDQLIRDNRRYAPSDSMLAVAVWQTTLFIFYHELGHALIDMLDLPTTGREEDAVDQLATVIVLEAGGDGRDAALRGAAWFESNTRRAGARMPYWDEHSLDQQRYFNIICWVYGSDTVAHQALLGRDWRLPRERAARCPAEFDQMSRAWRSILARHKH